MKKLKVSFIDGSCVVYKGIPETMAEIAFLWNERKKTGQVMYLISKKGKMETALNPDLIVSMEEMNE